MDPTTQPTEHQRDPHADALDRALDDFVHGSRRRVQRLEPDLRDTVERVFALAELGGMTASGVRPVPIRRGLGRRPSLRQVLSVGSTIAAVLVLAVGIGIVIPRLQDDGGAPEFAAGVPTATTEGSVPITVPSLRATSCDALPRDRVEVIDILTVNPDADMYGAPGGVTSLDLPETLDELDGVLHNWQACRFASQTYSALSLVSANYIRQAAYGRHMPRPKYSESTIEEIVSGWEYVDAEQMLWDPAATGQAVIVRDTGAEIDVESASLVRVPVRMVDTISGEVLADGSIAFIYEQDAWRIYAVEIDVTAAPWLW